MSFWWSKNWRNQRFISGEGIQWCVVLFCSKHTILVHIFPCPIYHFLDLIKIKKKLMQNIRQFKPRPEKKDRDDILFLNYVLIFWSPLKNSELKKIQFPVFAPKRRGKKWELQIGSWNKMYGNISNVYHKDISQGDPSYIILPQPFCIKSSSCVWPFWRIARPQLACEKNVRNNIQKYHAK